MARLHPCRGGPPFPPGVTGVSSPHVVAFLVESAERLLLSAHNNDELPLNQCQCSSPADQRELGPCPRIDLGECSRHGVRDGLASAEPRSAPGRSPPALTLPWLRREHGTFPPLSCSPGGNPLPGQAASAWIPLLLTRCHPSCCDPGLPGTALSVGLPDDALTSWFQESRLAAPGPCPELLLWPFSPSRQAQAQPLCGGPGAAGSRSQLCSQEPGRAAWARADSAGWAPGASGSAWGSGRPGSADELVRAWLRSAPEPQSGEGRKRKWTGGGAEACSGTDHGLLPPALILGGGVPRAGGGQGGREVGPGPRGLVSHGPADTRPPW